MKEKLKNALKRTWVWTVLFVVVALFMSLFANIAQSSWGTVKVTKGVVDMDAFYTQQYAEVPSAKLPTRLTIGDNKDGMVNAKLSYQLYMPKGVSKDNPAPAIALTHGYLNSKEFEEAPAIELSRRGYVVFAFDQYDHGDSTWDTPAAFNFYVWSAYDAVEYLYAQPYVLKDADGNGMIAVSGHSMGGFGSELAVAWDEMNYQFGRKDYRMLCAALAVGADFRYDDGYVKAYSGGIYPNTYLTYNNRTVGTIAAEYDEFFFDNSGKSSGTVIRKDYLSDSVGKAMLGISTDGENGKFYQIEPQARYAALTAGGTNVAPATEYTDVSANYGERVIYVVKGDHPYNTWSTEATKDMVTFYTHAFTHQLASHGLKTLADYKVSSQSGNIQTWYWKEIWTCLGLIALMAAVWFGIKSLLEVPFVNKAVITDAAFLTPVPEDGKAAKVIGTLLTIFATFLSGWLIPTFMDQSFNGTVSTATDSAGAKTTTTSFAAGLVGQIANVLIVGTLLIGVVLFIIRLVKGKENTKDLERPMVGSFIISAVSMAFRWLCTDGTSKIILGGSSWFNAPSVNTIVYWAMASGLLSLIVALIAHYYIHQGRDVSHLGLKAGWKQIGTGFLVALAVSLVCCGFVWLVNVIFKTDFRVYTYAIKTVNGSAIVSGLRYLPLFFIFYLCAGINIAVTTAGKKGWKADLLAVTVETAPVLLFLLYQYSVLYTTGVAPFSGFALNGILAQGLVITLIGLAIYQRRTLEKTGNIWTGVFFNTIFFTFITLANTTLYNL